MVTLNARRGWQSNCVCNCDLDPLKWWCTQCLLRRESLWMTEFDETTNVRITRRKREKESVYCVYLCVYVCVCSNQKRQRALVSIILSFLLLYLFRTILTCVCKPTYYSFVLIYKHSIHTRLYRILLVIPYSFQAVYYSSFPFISPLLPLPISYSSA